MLTVDRNNNKTTTTKEHNTMKTKQSGPGRPAYVPKLPTKLRWTMLDLQVRNEVNPATGKGPNCSKLTLVNWLADELANRRSGLVLKVNGETKEPNSKSGLGRKAFVYVLRSRKDELDKTSPAPAKPVKTAKKSGLKTAAKSPVSVKLNTASYEATKAAILAPTPAPVVAATPEPAPAPAEVTSAPVAETPVATAPVEPVAAQ